MTGELVGTDVAPLERNDATLLDLDGVVYRGPHAIDHAADVISAIRRHGQGVMYVTNNANRPPGAVAEHLSALGIQATAEEVTTAAQAAAALVAAERPAGTRVLVVGGPGLREAVAASGLTVVASADDEPAVVLQGFAPTVGWPDLSEALLAIHRGAEHIATNLDATIPMERGTAIGNGSLVAAIVHATGVQPRSCGKPRPEIFQQAAARAGAARPVVVGDRLDTDLEGARAAGYPGMHVLTGVDGPWALLRCISSQRPSLLAHDLRGLLVPHPEVTSDGEWWRCRGAAARVEGIPGEATLTVAGDGATRTLEGGVTLDLDELRAACAAAWAASDRADVATVLADQAGDIGVRTRPEDVSAIA